MRIAAIGVGHWHSLHDAAYLRHLAAMPEVAIVGVQDPDAAVAADRARAVGNPPVFTEYRELLAATRPDFVLALGTHATMAGIAHALIDGGFPFLMEKPMGLDAAEVAAVAEKAAARDAFVAVPLTWRYQPFVVHARRLLGEGRFGPVSHISFRLNRPTSARYPAWQSGWMLDPASSGGGCLRNLGSHGLDVFRVLTGEAARVTGAQISARALGERVEDYASVQVRSASGVLGTIEVGNTAPRGGVDTAVRVSGRDALLVQWNDSLRFVSGEDDQAFAAVPEAPVAQLALRDALDHWKRGVPPPISVHDLAPVIALIDQAYALAAVPS